MKKIIAVAFIAISLTACTDHTSNTTSVDSTTMITSPSSDRVDSLSTTTTYTAAEGDIVYTNKKLKVMRGGKWVEADGDVTLDNGMVIDTNGKVKKAGRQIELVEGEVVNRSGDFFDKSGKAIENAWNVTKQGAIEAGKDIKEGTKDVRDALKEGANDAGNALKRAANKIGDKLKDTSKKH